MHHIHRSMDRRQFSRVATDVPLIARCGARARRARAVDLSSQGALIRGGFRDRPLLQRLAIEVGGTVHTLARTVWADDEFQAVRFVGLDDVDRLDIAEHLDDLVRARRIRRWRS